MIPHDPYAPDEHQISDGQLSMEDARRQSISLLWMGDMSMTHLELRNGDRTL